MGIRSLMIGDSPTGDTTNGFLMPVMDQLKLACDRIQNDPKLKDGYNAIGFSQGGQFLRGLAQTCPNPPMKTLVTFGGQHQGIFGFPKCPGDSTICEYVRKMLNWGAYTSFVQSRLVQAQYWHDPLQEEENIENFVMVMFTKDTMVVPKESAHFGYYAPGQDSKIVPLFESDIFINDRLGLHELNSTGRIHFLEMEGDHLQFTE